MGFINRLRSAACLGLLALAALSLQAAEPKAAPSLVAGRLVLRSMALTTTLATTEDGALRITVERRKGPVERPPTVLELPAGPPILAQPDGSFRSGSLRLVPKGPQQIQVFEGEHLRCGFEAWLDESTIRLIWTPEGARTLHGFGHAGKRLGYTRDSFELYHRPNFGDQTYLYMPFCFSDSGAAFTFNGAGKDALEVLGGRSLKLSTRSGRVDGYTWFEGDPARLVARYAHLSGARSLLPRWAFGYLQSRFGYRNEDEVRATVGRFKHFGIPLSALVLDLYWFKRMGDLDWDRTAYPDPEGFLAWMREQGVRLITISEPFFTKDSQRFSELMAAKGLARDAQGQPVIWKDWWDFGKGLGGGVLDPTVPAARELLSARYARLAEQGVDGFWIDLGEPERVPAEARFGPWSEEAFHNSFNLEWAKLVRAGFQRGRPGKRPFILSRSGFTGITGLGVSTWSGDVPATWKGLRDQLPLGLSASLSGLPFWGSDVGGFITRGGEAVPPDPELYLRWHQFGAFTPVYRAHGTGAREPWIYGMEWMERVKRVIELRHRLLPYIYSTAYQAWAEGLPMMRPAFFLEPGNPALRDDATLFLFGDALLVAPVTQALEKEPEKTLWLPKGGWYDAFTLERHEGGRDLTLKLSLDRFPLFYREGAIVPVDLGAGKEGLILFPGREKSRFTVFSDDGESEGYREGAGERLEVDLEADGVTFNGAVRERELKLLLPKAMKLGALGGQVCGADGPFQLVRIQIRPGTQHIAF